MRHPLQLAALVLTATTLHAQIHMPQLSHKEKDKGEDVSWLAPYATPTPDGRGEDLNHDPHFKVFLRDNLTARQTFWNENESLADTALEFLGVPGQVILDDNRYFSMDGCVPHFCPSRGLLFVDLGTAHPLIAFVAIDWVKDNKVPGQTGAEYTLWLFSNRPLTIGSATDEAGAEHVPPALIHTISRWAAEPTAGSTVLPNITNTVLVDPNGTPHQVSPTSLGITPAPKQTSATPETQK
jgi:hypothetical protein